LYNKKYIFNILKKIYKNTRRDHERAGRMRSDPIKGFSPISF